MRISEVVLQKQFHKVVQSEKVFLVLTLGGVVLTLSDKGGVGELIGIKLQIACTGRCCTISSRKKNTNVLQRRNTSELNTQIQRKHIDLQPLHTLYNQQESMFQGRAQIFSAKHKFIATQTQLTT